MSRTPSPTELFLAHDLPTEPSSEERQFANGQLARGAWLTPVRFLIATGIGVVATLAWQSYSGVAKETTAAAKEMSPDLETMRLSIDALATGITSNQTHMMRSIDQVAASQEQMTREILKLQEIEERVLAKSLDHPLQSASAAKPVWRPSQAPTTLIHAKSP
jgi:hypothetical protein